MDIFGPSNSQARSATDILMPQAKKVNLIDDLFGESVTTAKSIDDLVGTPKAKPQPIFVPESTIVVQKDKSIYVPPKTIIAPPKDFDLNKAQTVNIRKMLDKDLNAVPSNTMKMWRARPRQFSVDLFDVILDPWQEDVFELYIHNNRLALIASKGPGKTFCLALLGWHFFSTHYRPKIAALAITKEHLKSNLWAELCMWRDKSKLLTNSTIATAEKISMKGSELFSFIDARAFKQGSDASQQSSALAGLHSDNVAFLIDEGGLIPDSVLVTADAALSTGDSDRKKARLLVTGNPEAPQGLIYKAFKGELRQKWGIYTVSGDPKDPKRAPRVDINWAQDLIDQFGEDDPWVQINVFGRYPRSAVDALLSYDEIKEAMDRNVTEKDCFASQLRLGVDVARGGVDRTVFAMRRGLLAYPLEMFPSTETGPELAGKIALRSQDKGIERVFVDNTGGYGSSVIDSLQLLPVVDVTPVVYNAKAQDKRYFNKRTEMWVRMRDWVRKGGKLPNDPGLVEELMMPKLIFHGGVFRLEAKEQIKARLGRSPDKADALAQTFCDIDQVANRNNVKSAEDLNGRPLWEIMEVMKRSEQNNYVSDYSQIDSSYQMPSNYRA